MRPKLILEGTLLVGSPASKAFRQHVKMCWLCRIVKFLDAHPRWICDTAVPLWNGMWRVD